MIACVRTCFCLGSGVAHTKAYNFILGGGRVLFSFTEQRWTPGHFPSADVQREAKEPFCEKRGSEVFEGGKALCWARSREGWPWRHPDDV